MMSAGTYDGTRQARKEGCDKACMEQRIAKAEVEGGIGAKILFRATSPARNLAYLLH